MAYRKVNRLFRKKYRGNIKSNISRARYSKKVKPLASAVSQVNRKINRLSKALPRRNRLYYHTYTKANLDNVTLPYTAYNLMNFNNWGRIFGGNADDETTRSCRIRNIKVQHYITHQNLSELDSTQTCTYTFFIVQLKKRGSYLLDETTGNLKTLVNGTHYVSVDKTGAGGLGGATLLNKEFFNIKAYKRFVLGNYAQPFNSGVVVNSLDKRFDSKLTLNLSVTNPTSTDWKSSIMPQNPQHNYHMILFCDNVLQSAEPAWVWQMVATVDTY